MFYDQSPLAWPAKKRQTALLMWPLFARPENDHGNNEAMLITIWQSNLDVIAAYFVASNFVNLHEIHPLLGHIYSFQLLRL